MRYWKWCLIIPAAALLVAACGGQPAPQPTTAPTKPTGGAPPGVDAARIYANSCASCHGPNRQGLPNLGPPLVPATLANVPDATLRETIANGRANTTMAPFKTILGNQEIDAVVYFIKNTAP